MTIPVTSAAQRRAEITDAIRRETGIEEAMIERLVRGLCSRPGLPTGSRISRACARSGHRSR